ncbi:MAG: DUF1003 domain-containing protein [Ginsengibacter sp.]
MDKEIRNIQKSQSAQMGKLRTIVATAIEDEKLIIENLVNPPLDILSKGQKISDKVAHFGGSWSFIIGFFIILTAWILYNSSVPGKDAFDPYPYILMNLILSCIAALQAPIIMMSQNRVEEKDRKRSENDYLINLKAELEIRSLHQKIDLLLEEQIKVLFDTQAQQLEIIKSIDKKISANK